MTYEERRVNLKWMLMGRDLTFEDSLDSHGFATLPADFAGQISDLQIWRLQSQEYYFLVAVALVLLLL